MGHSIGLGAGIGAASGFTASRFAEYNTKGTVVLTASGLLIGGAIAALLHKDPVPDRSVIPGTLFDGKPPSFRESETDVIWVPDLIQDGKYVEGHRIWTLSPSHWQLSEAEKEGKKNGDKGEERKEPRSEDSSKRKHKTHTGPVEE
jgi:hypothetical protein